MASKRDFKKNNPALSFISSTSEDDAVAVMENTAKAPEGYKVNPLYIETKSQRINCLMQPSIVEKAKVTAKARGISLNEMINTAVKEYLEREAQ